MTDTLYIDSNEPGKVRAAVELSVAERDLDAQTEVRGLKTGDFVFNNTVVERKEASDLASSIKDDRLREQTHRMLEDFQHQYIVVEGDPYDLSYSSLHDNAFIGTMVSRGHAGCSIVHTPDVDGTAYAIHKIMSKHTDEEEQRTVELGETTAEGVETEVAMLMQIEGVSARKAQKVLSDRSLTDIAQNDVSEQLQTIEGIGPVLARRIDDLGN